MDYVTFVHVLFGRTTLILSMQPQVCSSIWGSRCPSVTFLLLPMRQGRNSHAMVLFSLKFICNNIVIVFVVRSCVASLIVTAVFLSQCPGFAPGPWAHMALPSPFGGSRVLVSIDAFHALAAIWHDKCARRTLRSSPSK